MHMADALVAPAVAGTMYACSALAAGYSLHKIKMTETETKKIPLMGMMGAFVFAVQMMNFTIPGTGSSGHLTGGLMLSAILGPYAGFITMIGVLLVQCLLFADGGIMALGANIWNMAFYGCFIGGAILWRLSMRKGLSRKKIILVSMIGCTLTMEMGALSVTLETLASGITELPFSVFAGTMLGIHLAIGLVEGAITSTVLCFIYEMRPELLWMDPNQESKELLRKGKGNLSGLDSLKNRLSFRGLIGVFFLAFVAIGGLLSLVASALPDGLEWSVARVSGQEVQGSSGLIYRLMERLQSTTALLPDYGFKHSDTALGTSFSGILGGLVVIGLCIGISYLLRYVKKNMGKLNND